MKTFKYLGSTKLSKPNIHGRCTDRRQKATEVGGAKLETNGRVFLSEWFRWFMMGFEKELMLKYGNKCDTVRCMKYFQKHIQRRDETNMKIER